MLLSSFEPACTLRGQVARGATAATLRKALVVLQFSISIALIIATIVIVEQRRFAETMDLGALVLLANVMAWPVAYFAMQQWLSGFAYRIELGPLVFVASAVLALAVALLTVAAVATRAARAKPVATLRYE